VNPGFFRFRATFGSRVAWYAHGVMRPKAGPLPADASGRWGVLCGDLGWLDDRPDAYLSTFAELRGGRYAISQFGSLVHAIERTDWLGRPARAAAAATSLAGCIELLNRRDDPALDAARAMFDSVDEPDLSPAAVARLVHAQKSPAANEGSVREAVAWVRHGLVGTGRLDEACALLKAQPWCYRDDWIELARGLIAAGRREEAFALAESLPPLRRDPGELDHALAWMHLEAGDRDAAITALERAVAAAPEEPFIRKTLAAMRRRGRPPRPPTFRPPSLRKVAPVVAITRAYELVALLFGAAGDGMHMAGAAATALAYRGLRRHREEWLNHVAHARIGQALEGQAVTRKPRIVLTYEEDPRTPFRGALAARLLARLPDVGVTVR